MRIRAVNRAAAAAGLKPGITLADARALLPELAVQLADAQADEHALRALADWCTRYAPWAAPEGANGVFLDVSGATHLFGGEAALRQDLLGRLRDLGLTAGAAIAGTPGAAWAVARFGRTCGVGPIVPPGGAAKALAPLPVAALRLPADVVAGLIRVGLDSVEHLSTLPRAALARRFGEPVTTRLDQALGRAPEPISPRRPAPSRRALLTVPEPIGRADDIAAGLERLLATLCARLEQNGLGARRLEIALYRVDGTVARLGVGTSRPSRDAGHLRRLFAEHLGKIEPGLAVLNDDVGRHGRDLIDRFVTASPFRPAATLAHSSEIAPVIDAHRTDLVLHIGETFSRELKAGRSAPVQLIVDGRNSNTALITLGYASQIVAAFSREHATRPLPARLVERAWFNPNLLSPWSILPGILAIIILVATMAITSFSLAREKEVGTFQQLLVTPLRPFENIVGKTVPSLIIGLVESAVIVAVVVYLYEVPLVGHLGLLYVGIPFFLLANIGVGLMISSIARTQQQALLGAFLFLVPQIILSGFATPIANMPEWVQGLTCLNPMRYFLVISRGVFLKDLPADLVFAETWPMALIALATLTLAAWLFRRRLY